VKSEERMGNDGRPWTKHSIYYDGIGHGVGAGTKGADWGSVYTYGGKLVENADQAISRDLLAYGMAVAENMGLPIVGHVHDELIAELKLEPWRMGIDDLKFCMSRQPTWATTLPLGADGYESVVYKKG
jgi:DNA polymerase